MDIFEMIKDTLYRNCDNLKMVETQEDYIILTEDRIGKTYKISGEDLDTETLFKDNPKLIKYPDRGFRFGNYVEFLIDSSSVFDSGDFVLNSFLIGKVEVSIEKPSVLFDLVMFELQGDKFYDSSCYWTISLKGISKDNFEGYLSKAVFLVGYYNQSTFGSDYPNFYEFIGEDYYRYSLDENILEDRRAESDEFENRIFSDLKYVEALSFYNAGMSIKENEISFQYFYKVLEYFFLICRKGEFVSKIAQYNQSNNIDDFIKEVTSIYKQNEEVQLDILLKSINYELQSVINEAYIRKYIKQKELKSFSDCLYLYRNKIVHGKSDERFNIKLPSLVGNEEERFWTNTVSLIAEILIKKYCFN